MIEGLGQRCMTDRTRQIVEALMKAPEMVRALQQDPAGFVAQFGIDPGVLQAGKRVLNDVIGRLSAQGSPQLMSSTSQNPMAQSRTGAAATTCARGASGVPIAAVTSLAAITGMLAVLGTVSVIGINSNRHSDTV